MVKYKTDFGSIEKIEITSYDGKSIYYIDSGGRYINSSVSHNVTLHNTFLEAKEAAVKNLTGEISKISLFLENAKKRLSEITDLQEF